MFMTRIITAVLQKLGSRRVILTNQEM